MSLPKRVVLFFVLTFFFWLLASTQNTSVFAVSCEDIPDSQERIQEKIDCLQAKKTELASQSKTLSNQISQFNAQIRLAELKIKQTEEKISLLGGRIDQLGGSLSALSDAFSTRVAETYKMRRLDDPLVFLITSQDLTQAVTRFHYLKRIQEADREFLVRLQKAQDIYVGEKVDQEDLAEELEGQKQVLGAQKVAKDTLLQQTKNDEERFQELLKQAIAQKRAFSRFVLGQGGATILSNQTVCDSWGCYFNQRDAKWGNLPMGDSNLSVAEYGCLVTSVAMLAQHRGITVEPLDIANTSSAFFTPDANTALLLHKFDVNGVPVSLSWASKDRLDELLSQGPVVAGLYSGPDHFIVIKSKSGDDYIMHDPFMPNGDNRFLSERYNLSDITSLRIVNFN